VRNGQDDVDQAMDPFSAFGGQVICRTDYTVKKGLLFSRPQRDVTIQLSLVGNNLIIPGQGEFAVSDIPAGDGKIANLFLQCTYISDVPQTTN
jgi:hypothetical protein